ncbi:hypothetical protein BDN72DRAFT_769553 [Pluteus cervinus]|uniref:Uncharacterized protein n=1 Tax=Pluteus cervinus TaxID=181527 RepID=A0ACD3ARA4_9AGAR|nr:hypothetical protein BDN72DRAFT_769553 [Pluteus cervinus]
MQSLRSRSSQAPSRKNTTGTKLARPDAGPTPRPRDARKSRVDDKIKKRMSMRYADISGPTDLAVIPPMPSMPGLPSGGKLGGMDGRMLRDQDEVVRNRTTEAQEAERVASDDKRTLDKEDFDPDAFLKLKLANSTEAEIRSLQSSLRTAKDDTASELQHNVFKNYAEFVLISKEISTLENEMLELKDCLSEYKSVPSLLHVPDPTSTSSATLSTYKRSSVADLRIMYFNQMQELHADIEGSAKFVPAVPGRHIVGEVDNVLALNAATYKVMGRVKFVVLDDSVLVARRRRRVAAGEGKSGKGNANEGKLVAERCWSLNEMLVLDTKDSPNMTNVFKIRHGKETHVYRTETPAEKRGLLAQFRQVADELSAKRRKEREGEHERRKSMWQGGGDRSTYFMSSDRMPQVPEWMADLTSKAGEVGDDAKEKIERDSRWTNDWADDLTVAIALREWDKAVVLVEQGNAKLSTTPPLAAKLTPLMNQLTSSLLSSLSQPTNRKSTVIQLISLLQRLKAGAAARSVFLNMRTEVLRSHVRKIRFDGHIGSYVGDLATVYFTSIKHTADWFLASFKENEVASAFIDWAKHRIEEYAESFRRQVYVSDVEPQVIEEAIKLTHSQSRKLLQEYGIDFRFLFDEVLAEKPKVNVSDQPSFSFHAHRVSKPPDTPRRKSPAPRLGTLQPPTPSPSLPLPPSPVKSPLASPGFSSSSYQSATPRMPRSRTPVLSTASTSTTSSTSTSTTNTSSIVSLSASANASSVTLNLDSFSSNSASSSKMSTPPQSTMPLPSPSLNTPLRNTRTPPPPSPLVPLTPSSNLRDRPPRAMRGIGSPAAPPPPRSAQRPTNSVGQGGSAYGRAPPVAVPQREGMF